MSGVPPSPSEIGRTSGPNGRSARNLQIPSAGLPKSSPGRASRSPLPPQAGRRSENRCSQEGPPRRPSRSLCSGEPSRVRPSYLRSPPSHLGHEPIRIDGLLAEPRHHVVHHRAGVVPGPVDYRQDRWPRPAYADSGRARLDGLSSLPRHNLVSVSCAPPRRPCRSSPILSSRYLLSRSQRR